MHSSAGYTLIELLVVITIMAILALIGFFNLNNFSKSQITVKAVGQVQSLLRLAQSNATSSTNCNNQGATSWSVVADATNLKLRCNPGDYLHRTYTLENSRIEGIQYLSFPATFTYAIGSGALSIGGCSGSCATAASITFTIKNLINNELKSFNLSKGGAVNAR